MKISIAMCSYNGARFLDEQLASLISQHRVPDEVVVCDDCSTDTSPAVLKRFRTTAPFPVLLHENKLRLGSTKNFEQAIGLCRGELIFLCDQDDIWDPEKLNLTERCFIENPDVSLVFTNAEIVDEDAKSLGYTLWESCRFDKDLQARIKSVGAFKALNHRTLVTGATMAFRTEFRDLVLPIPENIPLIHDAWIALMVSLAGTLDVIDRPLIKYRQHSAQQIGASEKGQPGSGSRILAQSQRRYDFPSEILKLEAVIQRVQSTKHRYDFKRGVNLDENLKHLGKRMTISQRKLKRFPLAFGELLAGRYHRYSNGFYSLMKDLIQ